MDKKIVMLCFCSLIAIFVIPSIIRAASFDCSKANTKTEKAICNDQILSKLDEDMAVAYTRALKTSDRDAVKKEQLRWLKEILSACIEDRACIKEVYENRLRQLRWADGADRPAFFGRWRLIGRLWEGTLIIEKTHISLGSPECRNLRYTLIKHLPPGDQGDEEIYVIDVAAPPDKCRYVGQQKVIFHFRVKRDDADDILYIDECPSMEDLELFMRGRNRACSGTFAATKPHATQ